MGQFILTGSQQFGLISGVSQSLAGRVAKISLLPFSFDELQTAKKEPKKLEELLFKGLYPPVYDRKLAPSIWYGNYVDSYIERDVRQLINVRDLGTFQRFVRMCAARTGQILNLSSLASDCGVTHNTAKAWISVLEASYIIHLLQPYHKNFNKRFFYDPGLAAWLLNIQTDEQLATHSARGQIFETWVISELLKYRFNNALSSNLYFWRDNKGHEIDILSEQAQKLLPIEIKSGQTIAGDFFDNLKKFRVIAGNFIGEEFLIYGGVQPQSRNHINIVPWKQISRSFSSILT